MKLLLCVPSALLLCAALGAQGVVDTLGGTTSSPSGTGAAKGSVFAVEKSALLLKYEMYLNFTGNETLTFFRYRYHSQHGTYVRDWTKQVPVTGTGAGWYSSGVLALPMIAGNHYMLGVGWAGQLTYYYSTATTGQAVAFGSWYSARTPTGIPATISISGFDRALYYQRLTTIPIGGVVVAGKPCRTSTAPRLVAADLATIGGNMDLTVVEGGASLPAVFFLAPGPFLPQPVPIFGCELVMDPTQGILLTLPLATNASGEVNLKLPVPNMPGLSGFVSSWQALILEGSNFYLTNGVQFQL